MDYFIYKITIRNKSDFVYVGHTTNFNNRKKYHKFNCKNTQHRILYNTINENGGWENCEMLLIEHLITSKTDARIRENYWYETLKANMNMIKPYISNEERLDNMKKYYETNKKEIAEKGKIYREKNHEMILERKKIYYNNHKEEDNKRSKEYRETHKQEMKEYKKEWYEANKEKLQEKNNEKIKCECGIEYTRANKIRHFKSKRHMDLIDKQSTE
jgi:hypothetical protein